MCDVGLRVIRGPDWHWDAQDGGEGYVGTVTEFGTRTSPDKTVVVFWDVGYKTNYRIGYDGAYDLRIFDNASIGVTQIHVMCNGCKKQDFTGMRFKCAQCYDYDLCFNCYMNDCHDLTHSFKRYDTSSNNGCVDLPPRDTARKIEIKGVFIGAKVIRGPNWDWGDQDGGLGHVGNVTGIKGWDNETDRSVANVVWTKTGINNVYRIGHKGKVDIRAVKPAAWGTCYIDHLPVLGQNHNLTSLVPEDVTNFNPGEKVKVNVPEETLKILQEGHGGWNPRMTQYIGKVGIVHRVTDKGDVRVKFENCSNRWTFHPQALVKVNRFRIGDKVRIISDVAKVKELQRGHGEWLDIMEGDIGKIGHVTKIYSDGDLRVNIDDQAWTLNPLCIEPIPDVESTSNINECSEELKRAISGITRVIQDLETSEEASIDHILREVERGNLEFLDKYFSKKRSGDNLVSDERTCLHIACHEGQLRLVRFLLSIGANLETQDSEGDTALHYATYGNQPSIIETLLSYGMNVNIVNKNLCSALHIAVNKQFRQCARTLLRFQCNPNLQDSFGDTALHDAVGKGDTDLVNLLCNESNVDYTLTNNQGFNVLHTCALKGHAGIMEKLLQKAKTLVDVKKDDGFAAIHLSSLNGYKAVTKIVIIKGHSDINLRNDRLQTPLHLAASQKRYSVVELLVKLGAEVNAIDENGDTPLHLALTNKKSQTPAVDFDPEEAPSIFSISNKLQTANTNPENLLLVAMICYLLQNGCNISITNKNGQSCLSLIKKSQLIDILKGIPELLPRLETSSEGEGSSDYQTGEYSGDLELRQIRSDSEDQDSENDPDHSRSVPVECLVCSELADDNVILEPCKHKIACEECSSRMKKCIKCGAVISKRVTRDGRIIPGKSRQRSAERLRYLESKIAEIEEVHCCPICMERRRNVVFLCGHGACDRCSFTLTMCHMCRTVITKKINLY
ncbi:E3 ubiquitin-protein ligase MIB2 [Planococcus citri]|uniref:E3 ubiquitin-protein ligase MIB2 n=1 Tax=Planococcus citri TaxID=170843 RepID=UPI0031F894E7